ncbi:MAG TPA: hypothetical protein VLR26_14435 [Frankiaceae bacterium]|nr:hypothetical protein [Frankiaceae bacterium]
MQVANDLTAGQIEQVCTEIEIEMLRRVPALTQVFIDPSRVTMDDRDRLRRNVRLTLDDLEEIDGPEAVERFRGPRSRTVRRVTSTNGGR